MLNITHFEIHNMRAIAQGHLVKEEIKIIYFLTSSFQSHQFCLVCHFRHSHSLFSRIKSNIKIVNNGQICWLAFCLYIFISCIIWDFFCFRFCERKKNVHFISSICILHANGHFIENICFSIMRTLKTQNKNTIQTNMYAC